MGYEKVVNIHDGGVRQIKIKPDICENICKWKKACGHRETLWKLGEEYS